MTDNMRIATTIKDQIGIHALVMLGAKNILAVESGLSFRVLGSSKVNYIQITLTSDDLYNMEFGKVRGPKYKVVAEVRAVYNDSLNKMITTHTGLDTHL